MKEVFRMKFTIEELILLNKYVQHIITRETICNWFYSFEESDKKLIIKGIWMLALQAQVVESDIEKAAEYAGLKPTHTPVVMLSKEGEPFKNRGFNLVKLKGVVLSQAFELVLECFVLAEQRRRFKEGSLPCQHWWHRDLSDEMIIKDILKNNT